MKQGPPQTVYEGLMPGCIPREGLALVTGSKVYGARQDRRKLFEHAIGVDIEDGEGVDYVQDLELPIELGGYPGPWDPFVAHIDCVSTLEHVQRPWLAAKNLQDVLVQGGTIFVSVPWVWRYHSYGGDHYRYNKSALPILFDEIEWTTLMYYSQRDGLTREYPKPTKEYPFMIPRCEVFGWGVKR